MRFTKAWAEHIEARCHQVIEVLEGDGSVMVDAARKEYDPIAELVHQVSQETVKDYRAVLRRQHGFDPDVFFAERLALYFTAWCSWVTEAKSRDAARNRRDRLNYWNAHKDFRKELDAAICAGEDLVESIMRRRHNRILPRRKT